MAFAMVPPDDMTWADIIERDRIVIGHDEATARPSEVDLYSQGVASAHVDPSQSEPPGTPRRRGDPGE